MDNKRIKNSSIAGLLILLGAWQGVCAQEPPMPGVALQADAAQFQRMLEQNARSPGLPNVSAPVVPPMPAVPSTNNSSSLVSSPPMTYQQSQNVMLKSAPSIDIPAIADSDTAFNALMQQNMPLTPQQVIRLRQLIDASQRAASTPATVPPKPVSTTIMMNLAPGSTPPAIRLAQGYVTSLVFVDSTGAPWPIAAYDIGDPTTTNIQWDGKSNVLLIQAKSPYGDSDLVIRLAGLMTPLTLELVAGQRVVDFRTDIHVSGIGPNAKEMPTGTGLPNSANQLLLNVLDGIAPPGSKLLAVTGGDCQAWLLDDKMFLRTRLTVLSPGWVGRMVSPDGMFAYEIQKSSSVLVSQYGEPIELKIEGF
jgi:intracellular multiplication protein IcmK